MRLILLFVTILQKYTLTLRIVWTRTCCFYHESKMGMTPQGLLCTLKGSGSGGVRGLPRVLWVLYTMSPLYALYVTKTLKYTPYEKQMKGSIFKHLYTPACSAILVFTGFLAQPRCFVWLISVTWCHVTGLFHSRVNLMVLFLCCSLSATN